MVKTFAIPRKRLGLKKEVDAFSSIVFALYRFAASAENICYEELNLRCAINSTSVGFHHFTGGTKYEIRPHYPILAQ